MSQSTQPSTTDQQHQVVALKYRPKNFDALIGQNHISGALEKAIEQNKVGHAYLFTGARGVGKTSSARIFAKCLNCESGPTSEPCDQCDICQTISRGEDVDVLEIDGASNRGIDEIRSLRANAAVRPSRSRFKIYIIDEVHMLTTPAFNALLKTLEEPPGHVKFIFCTTDPQKIPITVLSRCQRFDFSPVQTSEIADSLKRIAASEDFKIDDEAVALLARRANGSMRDSQSLLEQLLSFCDQQISVENVHQLLGTADVGRIAELATAIVNHDATAALNQINQALTEGVNAGQLASQLLGYFRDAMAAKVGCGEDVLLTCTSADLDALNQVAENLGLETILSIVQVLDAALVKMEKSLHARTLLEIAAIRICNLENLDSLSDLVQQLSQSGGASTTRSVSRPAPRSVELKKVTPKSATKKNEIATGDNAVEKIATQAVSPSVAPPDADAAGLKPSVAPAAPVAERIADRPAANANSASAATGVATEPCSKSVPRMSSGNPIATSELESIWKETVAQVGDLTGDMAADYEMVKLLGADRLQVTLNSAYNTQECNKPDRKQKIESTLAQVAGRRYGVEFVTSNSVRDAADSAPPPLSRVQQIRKLQEHEFVKQATTLFDAEIVSFHPAKSKSSNTN